MIDAPEKLLALTGDLADSTWTLATIGALCESGLATQLLEPRTLSELARQCSALSESRIERCLAVAASVGTVVIDGDRYRLADGAACLVGSPARTMLEGSVRSHLMQALAFLDASSSATTHRGWTHDDPVLLQAQGDASTGFAGAFKGHIVKMLDGLEPRLDVPGARFLDVGVGVGSLAVALCRAFPQMNVVGLDVREGPLSIARKNVAKAGMSDRIELRRLPVEELSDDGTFDVVWLPSFFIEGAVMPTALARIHTALRPGGYVLLCVLANATRSPAQRAVSDLVTDLWGGGPMTTAAAESALRESGFADVRTLPGPPAAPGLVVGRR